MSRALGRGGASGCGQPLARPGWTDRGQPDGRPPAAHEVVHRLPTLAHNGSGVPTQGTSDEAEKEIQPQKVLWSTGAAGRFALGCNSFHTVPIEPDTRAMAYVRITTDRRCVRTEKNPKQHRGELMDFNQLVWAQHPIGQGWKGIELDPVVWTSVELLEQAWRNTEGYVGPCGVPSDQPGKYKGVGRFLSEFAGKLDLYVPTASLVDGKVEFTDGRHRFAWLRDHGLTALPVEVGAECEAAYRRCFETDLRVGRLNSKRG